jgi:myo-inositol-1(or 4)-monophosphatase
MKTRSEILKMALLTAADVISQHSPSEGIIDKEGISNFVTAADLASEKAIVSLIKQHFPEDAILSEETESSFSSEELLSLDHLWIIDPIDGTNNFRYQRGFSCISIGYAEKGVIKIGGVYNFINKELFFAEDGKGAFVNDKKINVSSLKNLSEGVLGTDPYYTSEATRLNLSLVLKIEPTPFVLMRGAAALEMCDVAAGRLDLYFHTSIKPWDMAAASLIISEAGGVIKNTLGGNITFLSPEVVVGNAMVVGQFVMASNNP